MSSVVLGLELPGDHVDGDERLGLLDDPVRFCSAVGSETYLCEPGAAGGFKKQAGEECNDELGYTPNPTSPPPVFI